MTEWDAPTASGQLLLRLDNDRAEMLAIIEGLDADAWNGFIVWQSTADSAGIEPLSLGVRVTWCSSSTRRASCSP